VSIFDYGTYEEIFELEYMKDNWYPLINGKIPAKDEQGIMKFPNKKPKSWTEYPETTHVGWRGPMILWSDVKKMPGIYYGETS